MLSGPEIARLANEFQNAMSTNGENSVSLLHHDTERRYKAAIHKDATCLEEAIE